MGIEDKVNRLRTLQEQKALAEQQELERGIKEAESFINNVAEPKFEETNRDVFKGRGKVSKRFLSGMPDEIFELVLEWTNNYREYKDRKEYRLTIEAGKSKPYRLYPGEEIQQPKEGIHTINPNSPKCVEDLEDAIANFLVHEDWCRYAPYFPSMPGPIGGRND